MFLKLCFLFSFFLKGVIAKWAKMSPYVGPRTFRQCCWSADFSSRHRFCTARAGAPWAFVTQLQTSHQFSTPKYDLYHSFSEWARLIVAIYPFCAMSCHLTHGRHLWSDEWHSWNCGTIEISGQLPRRRGCTGTTPTVARYVGKVMQKPTYNWLTTPEGPDLSF